jgi:hypothetical protein
VVQVYVALLDEVYRPVDAAWRRDDIFEILPENRRPEDEQWQFSPCDLVRCRERTFSEGASGLVAFERVDRVPWWLEGCP